MKSYNKFFIVYFYLFFPLFSAEFEPDQHLQPWMIEQIDQTVNQFSQDLSKRNLNFLFLNESLALLRVKKIDNQLLFEESTSHPYKENWKEIFTNLNHKNRLPNEDFDLLITCHDMLGCGSCNRPIKQNNVWIYSVDTSQLVERLPIFVQADCLHKKNILIPDFLHLDTLKKVEIISNYSKIISWNKKKIKMFFRGSDSDILFNLDDSSLSTEYFNMVRSTLIKLSIRFPDLIDARFIPSLHFYKFFNETKKRNMLGHYIPIENHGDYKYLIDLDGNCASNPRNQMLYFTNSLVLKVGSISVSWFYPGIKPYEHYIPIAPDLSDLIHKIDWAKENDPICKQIAENGNQNIISIMNQDTIDAYIYTLLKKYAERQKLFYLDP